MNTVVEIMETPGRRPQTGRMPSPTTSIAPILVTGASGKTGTRVTRGLEARGLPVRAASRSGAVPFSWEDRSTWAPALDGAGAVSIAYAPDLAVPGAGETVAAFARAATEAGVRRVVLLSGRGEEDAQRAELLVREAAPQATVVRAAFFMQNFSESVFAESLLDGELALPVGDVSEPFVDAEDVAAAMVAALAEDGHEGRTYEVTGPRMLTFAEAVAEISAATGRDVRYVTVPAADYAAALAGAGLPDGVAGLLMYLFTEVLDGRNASLTDGVEQALGRPPRDFAAYAADAARAGAWALDAAAAR
jgi:uncharacterized protein YbjT (DUF2867 family)